MVYLLVECVLVIEVCDLIVVCEWYVLATFRLGGGDSL